MKNVLVTGGAGYVGCILIPKLLEEGYCVKVLDLFLYGAHVLDHVSSNPALTLIRGDIRDKSLLKKEIAGMDAVIHLACISNDPSYELNPDLSRTINYDASLSLIDIAKEAGVQRFIFASSSSVYGVKKEPHVTEDLPLEPLTDYSKYKALCEEYLLGQQTDDFTVLILRPATVCGYSPRLRLDLTVNILTNHAINHGKIIVLGGDQKRPNIHIDDIAELYVEALRYPRAKIAGKIFNCGYENHTVREIAEIVKRVLAKDDLVIEVKPSDDKRSYSISSQKIKDELGFVPRRTIADAVRDLKEAFAQGLVPRSMDDPRYYNIKTMQQIGLK